MHIYAGHFSAQYSDISEHFSAQYSDISKHFSAQYSDISESVHFSAHYSDIYGRATRRRAGTIVTVSSPSGTEVRSGPGGTGGWAVGVDSEVLGPVPAPVMSGSTWAL
jgi:hypothetical protein